MSPILILDDSRSDLRLAEITLRNCKIRNPIITFQAADDFLAYFSGDFETPALVLLDMIMQPKSGIDVLGLMQQRDLTDRIPFIMISGLAHIKVLQQGYQKGARTFIIKPINQDDILQLLGKIRGLEIQSAEGGYILSCQVK